MTLPTPHAAKPAIAASGNARSAESITEAALLWFLLGKPEYTATHEGAIYRFASAENRDAFKADPSRYAPAYGGYCALGTSFGKKFEVDGKAFKVFDGKLYVNKNLNVYKTWVKDVPGNIEKADSHWPKIRDVAARDL